MIPHLYFEIDNSNSTMPFIPVCLWGFIMSFYLTLLLWLISWLDYILFCVPYFLIREKQFFSKTTPPRDLVPKYLHYEIIKFGHSGLL